MLSFGYVKFEGPDHVVYIPFISLSTKIPKALAAHDGMLPVLLCTMRLIEKPFTLLINISP